MLTVLKHQRGMLVAKCFTPASFQGKTYQTRSFFSSAKLNVKLTLPYFKRFR